jgi:hypothetical protein
VSVYVLPCASACVSCLLLCCTAVRLLQVVHDTNGATNVSDLTLIDVNTPQVRQLLYVQLHICSATCAAERPVWVLVSYMK